MCVVVHYVSACRQDVVRGDCMDRHSSADSFHKNKRAEAHKCDLYQQASDWKSSTNVARSRLLMRSGEGCIIWLPTCHNLISLVWQNSHTEAENGWEGFSPSSWCEMTMAGDPNGAGVETWEDCSKMVDMLFNVSLWAKKPVLLLIEDIWGSVYSS